MFNITKEDVKGVKYVNISIKNNTINDIIVFTSAAWSPDGIGYYERGPISFIKFTGHINSGVFSSKKITTGKLVLGKDLKPEKGASKKMLLIKAGETFTQKFRLIGEVFIPAKVFDSEYSTKIRKVTGTITLDYLYGGDKKSYKVTLSSNTIIL